MRQFRGKLVSGDLGWIYGYYVFEDEQYHMIYTDGDFHEVDPKTVGQFSGVHDDEGYDELYEGDTIEMFYKGEKVVGSIQYCGGGFILASDDFVDGFMWVSELTENDGRYFWIPTAERVGCIYDHPELIAE